MRVHYVARLKAIDTSEKDRAVSDLEKAKRGYRYNRTNIGAICGV